MASLLAAASLCSSFEQHLGVNATTASSSSV
jgi:hypothetical protein